MFQTFPPCTAGFVTLQKHIDFSVFSYSMREFDILSSVPPALCCLRQAQASRKPALHVQF